MPEPEPQRFRARLESAGGGGAAFDVPPVAVAALGAPKRPPVTVTIGGHSFRTTVAVYGGQPIGVRKEHREAAGVAVGDAFDVSMALDHEPRTVELPDDLGAALAEDDAARAAFDARSYTHRRNHVEWIAEAKRAETRARRIAETVERVRDGRSAP